MTKRYNLPKSLEEWPGVGIGELYSVRIRNPRLAAHLVSVAKAQLFQHRRPENEVKRGLELIVTDHLVGTENFRYVDREMFYKENRALIDPLVETAIARAWKEAA